MLKLIVAFFILSSLIFYALMGGADFGGGIWNLLAFGSRAKRQREAIADAIAPIWEANHVWLILVIVLLFTGFPGGFATMMTALNIPITMMLLGIVLRGSAFVFRKYDVKDERRWNTLFAIASFLTPFFQGVILGALTTGQIRVEQKGCHHRLHGRLADAICAILRCVRARTVCLSGSHVPHARHPGRT